MSDTVDLDTIEALAKAATEGPWTFHRSGDRGPGNFYGVLQSTAGGAILDFPSDVDGEYICALNPAVVLQWVAETRELRRLLATAKEGIYKIVLDTEAKENKLRVAVKALEFYGGRPRGRGKYSGWVFDPEGIKGDKARTALDEINKLSGERKK